MASTTADTSFVFALYGQDAHTATARTRVSQLRSPLILTVLQRFEFSNAMRFAAFRKAFSAEDALNALAAFESDLRRGFVAMVPCDWEAIVEEAERISARHTIAGGHRSFDVLHVAAARVLKAGEFLTFDANQRRLAKAVGLSVGP